MKTLKLTTTLPSGILGFFTDAEPLVKPNKNECPIQDKVKGDGCYIHGDAEKLAGFDIPYFIDGNFGQLDLPVEEQDILLLLPSGEYKCKAELVNELNRMNYYITLK